MLHSKRTWVIDPAASAEQLADNLTRMTWCGCNGFELDGYLFLNDATSGNGAQEYAVVKRDGPGGKMLQVESITFSWCSYDRALNLIRRVTAGEYDTGDYSAVVEPRIETKEEHGRCHLCA